MAETATKTEAPPLPKKPRQGRSPAFPFISLSKALERAETFRVAEGGRPKHFSPLVAAAKAWSIGPKTGVAVQTVAALGHYGLFEFQGTGEKREARLTDLAFRILLDKQPVSPERDAAIRQAALKPAIHADLAKKWPLGLPSDATLETYLVRDRGFSESGARDLMTEYKATIAFAKICQPDNIPSSNGENVNDDGGSDESETPDDRPPPSQTKVKILAGERELTTGILSKDASFRVIVSGPVGVKEIERLIKKLELDRDILADAASSHSDDDLDQEESVSNL